MENGSPWSGKGSRVAKNRHRQLNIEKFLGQVSRRPRTPPTRSERLVVHHILLFQNAFVWGLVAFVWGLVYVNFNDDSQDLSFANMKMLTERDVTEFRYLNVFLTRDWSNSQ